MSLQKVALINCEVRWQVKPGCYSAHPPRHPAGAATACSLILWLKPTQPPASCGMLLSLVVQKQLSAAIETALSAVDLGTASMVAFAQ